MSNHVIVSKEINAPAAKVFDMVTRLERMGEWSPEATGGTWTKGATGPALGARFEGTNANEKTRWKTTAIVTKYDPPKGFSFRVIVGPIKVALWNYVIEPLGDTSCRVTESWTDQRAGFAKFVGKKSTGVEDRAAHNQLTMQATLDKLAAAAEA
jgi:uncharacterized protein YndB with AHSA1/START domain